LGKSKILQTKSEDTKNLYIINTTLNLLVGIYRKLYYNAQYSVANF
jgi:hypothetical protein